METEQTPQATPEEETRPWAYKPYDHPMAESNPEYGMSDESYHAGIQIVVRDASIAQQDGHTDKVSIVNVKGLTRRGGRDLIFIVPRTDNNALHGFTNALLVQLGVASTRMRDDEVAKLVTVPLPQFKRLFLPPMVAIAKLGEGALELISHTDMINLMEFDEVPQHTLVMYDQYARNPQDPKFDRATFTQVIMTDFDLNKLDDNEDFIQHNTEQLSALDPDNHALMAENLSPSQALNGLYGGDISALLNEPEHGGVGNDTAMDLERMSDGQVGETELSSLVDEDEAYEEEVARLSAQAQAEQRGLVGKELTPEVLSSMTISPWTGTDRVMSPMTVLKDLQSHGGHIPSSVVNPAEPVVDIKSVAQEFLDKRAPAVRAVGVPDHTTAANPVAQEAAKHAYRDIVKKPEQGHAHGPDCNHDHD